MTSYADYLFLLSPPEPVKELVSKYKKACAKYIGNFNSMHAPAHISLCMIPRQKPFFADYTIIRMQQSLGIMPPVLLHIDGFKYFTHLHNQYTIYAHIRITPSVDSWFIMLKKNLAIRKTLVPHITIARNISGDNFNILWPHLRHKKLVEPFWINELKILKRETFGSFPKWEPFKTFEFRGTKDFMHLDTQIDDAKNQINLF